MQETKTAVKQQTQKQMHTQRVASESDERGTNDGYWFILKNGWTLDDASTIHEPTRRGCLRRLCETRQTRPAAIKIKCPNCGRRMELGRDGIAGDYYAQCRNRRCDYDGWFAPTLHDLVEREIISSLTLPVSCPIPLER